MKQEKLSLDKFAKKYIMENYYSDEEIRAMMKIPIKYKLRWLAEVNYLIAKYSNKKVARRTNF